MRTVHLGEEARLKVDLARVVMVYVVMETMGRVLMATLQMLRVTQ